MITRIRMDKTAAGPMGSWRAEREYAVPGEMPRELAEAFVASGAAAVTASRAEEIVAEQATVEVEAEQATAEPDAEQAIAPPVAENRGGQEPAGPAGVVRHRGRRR